MLASLVRFAGLSAAILIAPGCGGDDEIVNDGDPGPIDGSVPDAPVDAENLCPGARTFEALASNLEAPDAEFDVALAEVGEPGNSASSAPNGRVVLCLPAESDFAVEASKTDYLTRVDAVLGAAADILVDAGQPYPLLVIAQAALETLYTDLGPTFDDGDAQVVVSVIQYPTATPLTGAVVEIDKANNGSFARDIEGGFAAGDQIADGGLILFANVPVAGGDVAITVTPPDRFRGTCTGPAALGLTAGQMSGALFACQ